MRSHNLYLRVAQTSENNRDQMPTDPRQLENHAKWTFMITLPPINTQNQNLEAQETRKEQTHSQTVWSKAKISNSSRRSSKSKMKTKTERITRLQHLCHPKTPKECCRAYSTTTRTWIPRTKSNCCKCFCNKKRRLNARNNRMNFINNWIEIFKSDLRRKSSRRCLRMSKQKERNRKNMSRISKAVLKKMQLMVAKDSMKRRHCCQHRRRRKHLMLQIQQMDKSYQCRKDHPKNWEYWICKISISQSMTRTSWAECRECRNWQAQEVSHNWTQKMRKYKHCKLIEVPESSREEDQQEFLHEYLYLQNTFNAMLLRSMHLLLELATTHQILVKSTKIAIF